MRITEIYQSIQGESSFAGLPCIFVRTTGCDLRCSWCDSEFAFYGGKKLSLEQIIKKIQSFPIKLVELTGGEPLLQKDIPILAYQLLELGYTVMIETGGHRDVSVLDTRVIKIMDIKCPASRESEKNLWSNLDHLTPQDEIKFVIADRSDYEWVKDIINKYNLGRFRLLASPVYGKMQPQDLVEWILTDNLPVRFQLQLHKYVWAADQRGV
ncbi:MAG: radical SAM protein [Blastocatellia bacterium]|nr:radical SAM protein [Blastocatellia bacterium]MBL8195050.1 radical SAM protein [Blastocatellia bacterium]